MPEYTILAVLAVVGVLIWELRFARSGILSSRAFWISMAISAFFMVLVDGWLTKLSAPIVIYDDSQISGLRFPFDIPVEDYLFGFAMIVIAVSTWVRLRP
jgi:lycopene cyclase domain-containing protein